MHRHGKCISICLNSDVLSRPCEPGKPGRITGQDERKLMLSTPNKIVSLLLTFALLNNPFLGVLAGQVTDAPTALIEAKSVISMQDEFFQAGQTGNAVLSSSDCCYQDNVGICGTIDCQYCCSPTMIQVLTSVLFNDAYIYSHASNTGREGLEFPPATPPPLTISH